MNRKNLLLVITALLLVAIGNWLTEQGVKQVDHRLAQPAAVQQDYYINDVTITALDPDGMPQHRLQATQLNHFIAAEQTELVQPKLVVLQQQVEWQISAERGQVNPQQDELRLQGKVQLRQPGKAGTLKLTTPALRIQPGQGIADTDQPVTLTQGSRRIEAVGMRIEQKSQRLLLLSQVRGRYETVNP